MYTTVVVVSCTLGFRVDIGDELQDFSRDEVTLNKLGVITQVSELPDNIDTYKVRLAIHQSQDVLDVLQPLSSLIELKSRVFDKICFKLVNRLTVTKGDFTIDEAATEIWKPAIKNWNDLQTRLKRGSATCADVVTYFGGLNDEDLHIELGKFSVGPKEREIENQMKIYFKMQQMTQTANAILATIDVLGLRRASFPQLQHLADLVCIVIRF